MMRGKEETYRYTEFTVTGWDGPALDACNHRRGFDADYRA